MPSDAQEKHVFVSYVRENSDEVDKLCAVLDAVNIPYWRDRSNLGPGDEWKVKIREAIRSGSMAFLACFSNESRAKDRSYMNEELTLATEEWRMRPPGRTWLIPVRFDDGPVPEWDLGAGKTLSDLNYSDLFGKGYTPNVAQLVEKIKDVMGLSASLDPAVVRTAVEEASAEHRPRLLRQMAKDMVPDPTREIQLNELVTDETSRMLRAMRDTTAFPTHTSTRAHTPERAVELATIANKYWDLVEPFCWSLQVAARWAADPAVLRPWAGALRSLCAEGLKTASGSPEILDLRQIPALVATFVAALACTGGEKWGNFKTLLVDTKVEDRQQKTKLAIIERVSPSKPFVYNEPTSQVLALSAEGRKAFDEAAAEASKVGRKTPVADWLHTILQPIFDEEFLDDDAYDSGFDLTEGLLGTISQDLVNFRVKPDSDLARLRLTYWDGRSAWRVEMGYTNPVEELSGALAEQGAKWPLLTAGLFGGSFKRANEAMSIYAETFADAAHRHRFR